MPKRLCRLRHPPCLWLFEVMAPYRLRAADASDQRTVRPSPKFSSTATQSVALARMSVRELERR